MVVGMGLGIGVWIGVELGIGVTGIGCVISIRLGIGKVVRIGLWRDAWSHHIWFYVDFFNPILCFNAFLKCEKRSSWSEYFVPLNFFLKRLEESPEIKRSV